MFRYILAFIFILRLRFLNKPITLCVYTKYVYTFAILAEKLALRRQCLTEQPYGMKAEAGMVDAILGKQASNDTRDLGNVGIDGTKGKMKI